MPGGVKFYLENDILPAYSNRLYFRLQGSIKTQTEGSKPYSGD
jgi:hypothetical protein